jgi:hypothetical protein
MMKQFLSLFGASSDDVAQQFVRRDNGDSDSESESSEVEIFDDTEEDSADKNTTSGPSTSAGLSVSPLTLFPSYTTN